jgi:hypothetical protein
MERHESERLAVNLAVNQPLEPEVVVQLSGRHTYYNPGWVVVVAWMQLGARQGRLLPATYLGGGAFGLSGARDSAKLATHLSQMKISAMTVKVLDPAPDTPRRTAPVGRSSGRTST